MTRAARDERRQNRGPAARRRRPQTRSVSVGVMALMGALVLTGILFGLGDSELLSARTFDVYAEFGRINGIGRGSAVHVAGAAAGEVTDIRFPRSPAEKFRLTLRVRERFHGLVRTDSVVSLQTGGVVGGKLVQIEPGDDAALQAPAGSTLATAEDKHAADPLARARSVLVSVDTALDTARAKLAQFRSRSGGDSTPRKTKPLLSPRIAPALENVAAKVSALRSGRGSIGSLLTTDDLHDRASRILQEANANLAILNTRLAELPTIPVQTSDPATQKGSGEDGPLASAAARLASVSAATERLKRNFFFRGFFEDRGYYDLDAISPDDYRKGALEVGGRRAVRIWIRHDVLFETIDGQERLTSGGTTRLESAMSELLRLPSDSPIVIEGYAAGGGYEDRRVASGRRAELARAYLVSRFGLMPTRVGVVGLGDSAPDSPAHGSWDGIAIATFVRIAAGR